ncbi:hypothetical protein PVL29_024567 [Vitis rotundifolia]|uniref:Uncharacterized protein n=1 Tax=Vitis rotundifolia TaxID=103349 RepID=A0AA39DA00_VITRO|nr:hypothetical protein PVL29_024567 [Vitis rotundifolia]
MDHEETFDLKTQVPHFLLPQYCIEFVRSFSVAPLLFRDFSPCSPTSLGQIPKIRSHVRHTNTHFSTSATGLKSIQYFSCGKPHPMQRIPVLNKGIQDRKMSFH